MLPRNAASASTESRARCAAGYAGWAKAGAAAMDDSATAARARRMFMAARGEVDEREAHVHRVAGVRSAGQMARRDARSRTLTPGPSPANRAGEGRTRATTDF